MKGEVSRGGSGACQHPDNDTGTHKVRVSVFLYFLFISSLFLLHGHFLHSTKVSKSSVLHCALKSKTSYFQFSVPHFTFNSFFIRSILINRRLAPGDYRTDQTLGSHHCIFVIDWMMWDLKSQGAEWSAYQVTRAMPL